MKKHICFRCGKEIVVGVDRYMMVPLEVPYMNLFFHKDNCYISYDVATTYMLENVVKILKNAQK